MPATIMYVINSLEVGGAERHLVQLVENLDRSRFQPMVCTMAPSGVLAPRLRAQGVTVLQPPLADYLYRRKWPRRMMHAASWLWLIFVMLRLRPAIVHAFLPHAYISSGIAKLFARRPHLVMSRRSMNNYQDFSEITRRLERWLFSKTRAALGNSQRVVDQLDEEGFAPDRLFLNYNGVEASRFAVGPTDRQASRTSLQLDQNALVMVLIANLIPYKGHADLLHALADIKDRLPENWHLICVGRDDGIGPELEETVDRLALNGHVRWLGQQNDITPYLAVADMGCLVSHQEGFSNAILEGMAASLPMVVTDVGGNGEAVLNGSSGYVVPAHDRAALGDAILSLALDPVRRREMGMVGRDRVEELFSPQKCMARYEKLYTEILSTAANG